LEVPTIYIYISIYKGSARGDTPNFYGQKYGTNLAPFYDQFPLIIFKIPSISRDSWDFHIVGTIYGDGTRKGVFVPP